MALRRIRSLVVAPDAFLITRQEQIIELAAEQRLPTIYATRGAVLRGGLMSYGALTNDMYRSAGTYAGRIQKRNFGRLAFDAAGTVRVRHQQDDRECASHHGAESSCSPARTRFSASSAPLRHPRVG